MTGIGLTEPSNKTVACRKTRLLPEAPACPAPERGDFA